MGRKLYVGKPPFSVTAQTLQSKFPQHGTVAAANRVTDRETGRDKGFGCIEMRTDAEASAAICELNGAELEARPIKVNEAKPQARRSDCGRSGGGNRW